MSETILMSLLEKVLQECSKMSFFQDVIIEIIEIMKYYWNNNSDNNNFV